MTALLLLAGCAPVPPRETADEARHSLLAAHDVERETHLARDADRLTTQASEGFVLIDAGEISVLSVAE